MEHDQPINKGEKSDPARNRLDHARETPQIEFHQE